VPEHAPEAKLAAIDLLGGQVRKLPYDGWWNAILISRVDGVEGCSCTGSGTPGLWRATGRSAWRSSKICRTRTRTRS